MKLKELFEKLSSQHVIDRADLTAIMNLVHKEFGLSYNTGSANGGLCLVTQALYSIMAVAEVDEAIFTKSVEAQSHIDKPQRYNLNVLEDIIKFFGEREFKVNETEVAKFKTSLHEVANKSELLSVIKNGQPAIAVFHYGGWFSQAMNSVEDYFDNGEEFISKALCYQKRVKDKFKAALKSHMVTKSMVRAFAEYDPSAGGGSFHSILCFGYDASEKAFLFREARDSYAAAGYFKVAEDVIDAGFFEKMFYLQVDEVIKRELKNGR